MKKLIIAVALVLLLAAPCFGAVGVNNNPDDTETYVGEATNICFEGQEVTFDGSKVTVLANGHKAGVTANVSTESHLTSAALAYGTVAVTFSKNKKVTIANGTPGQMITIFIATNTGYTSGVDYYTITDDGVDGVTAAALLATGWDDIALDAQYDSVTLLYVDDTYGWIIVGQYGATIT